MSFLFAKKIEPSHQAFRVNDSFLMRINIKMLICDNREEDRIGDWGRCNSRFRAIKKPRSWVISSSSS